jgi:hypothetical protein
VRPTRIRLETESLILARQGIQFTRATVGPEAAVVRPVGRREECGIASARRIPAVEALGE